MSQSTAHSYPAPGLRSKISTAAAIIAGAVLRLWMLKKFFEVSGDSRIYGGIARNLLLHGRYAMSDGSGVLHSTLIRLPGYPLFLAVCFRLFGMENYYAASVLQIVLELAGCCLLALFVFRISDPANKLAAAQSTLWLAMLCPFTAVYAAQPLTEGLTLFCLSLALWSAAGFRDKPTWPNALVLTFAITYAALLRPDGALVGVALAPALFSGILIARRSQAAQNIDLVKGKGFSPYVRPAQSTGALAPEVSRSGPQRYLSFRHSFVPIFICLLLALAPFAAWTWRNWRTFHVVEPLAPRYATDPGEDVYPGWQRWVKTWCLDFVSTYQVYWNVPGDVLNLRVLPSRAFDSPTQYAETARLAADYEANGEELSLDLDNRFAQIAQQRIDAHPLRYFVALPLGRIADMWLRPRIENLPIDLDWWVYRHHYVETRFSWFYAGLNAVYLLLALVGLCLRPRMWPSMLAYIVLRSAMLGTIEAPEARYTLECFPILFALGGIAVSWVLRKRSVA